MGPYYPPFGSSGQPENASSNFDPASDPWQYINWTVPGWFVTDYDEENPLQNLSDDLNVKLGQDADMEL
jgi:hypothetical protein